MANDGQWDSDGGRLQGWLRRYTNIRGRSQTEGFIRSELGLVIARYFPDDADSKSGKYTEYDVWIPRYQVQISHLSMVTPYAGVSGGNQITLKPADGVPDMSDPFAIHQNVMDSDGDLVMVEYIGGKWPVITGCVNHLRTAGDGTDWHSDSNDGEVYSLFYNTTRARINSDGNVELDLDDAEAPPDRSLIINAGSKQLLKISYDDGAGEVRIELGSGGTLEKVILGETFQSYFNGLEGPVSHVHVYTPPSTGVPLFTTGPTKPLPPSTPASPIAMDSMANDNLTDKVKAEK